MQSHFVRCSKQAGLGLGPGVRFYGVKHDWLEEEIEQHGLSAITKQYGLVPMVEVWVRTEMEILMLLQWQRD